MWWIWQPQSKLNSGAPCWRVQLSGHTSSWLANHSLPYWDNQLWISKIWLELVALLKNKWLTHFPYGMKDLPGIFLVQALYCNESMCDKNFSSVAEFKVSAPIRSKRSLLTSGEHVILNLHILTGLVSFHIILYQVVQVSRNNTQKLSIALGSMTGWSVFLLFWTFASC